MAIYTNGEPAVNKWHPTLEVTPIVASKRRRRRKAWGSYRGTVEQRAAAAALLTRQGWTVKEAAGICCVNKSYVWLAQRLSVEDRYQLSHNRLKLAELSHDYKRQLAERRTQRSPEPPKPEPVADPVLAKWRELQQQGDSSTDANLDRLIGRFGADRVMAALDRVTAPQRVAAE
jgi:hypothetical protein